MFDITNITKTAPMVLSNILMVLILYLMLKQSLKGFIYPKSRTTSAALLMCLFCLFSFWGGDWFHYLEAYYIIKYYEITHMEDIYVSIAKLSPNYLVFRLVIWGSALLLMLDTYRRVKINYGLALLTFSVTWLIWFSYARVSLAMALMFWGTSIIYRPLFHRKWVSTAIGIIAIVVSFYFHKSAAFGMGVILLSVIASKTNSRITIPMTILLIPLMFYLVQYFLTEYMVADADASENAWEASVASGQGYLGREESSRGIANILSKFLEKIPYYLTVICCIKILRHNDTVVVPLDIKLFAYISFFIILISTIFAFDFGLSTAILYSRFMRFAAIPCVIVLVYCYDNQKTSKIAKYAIYSGMISTSYQLLYSLYLA